MKQWWLLGVCVLTWGPSACHPPQQQDRTLVSTPGNAGILSVRAPLGLPALPLRHDNALTQPKVDLGRKLFFERQLSHNNTMSCAMCHVPEQGFTSNEVGAAIGVEGRSHRRNAPTIINVGYQLSLFDDGREFTLENQVWGPLLSKNEMDMPSVGYVVEQVRQSSEYGGLFEAAFGGPVTAERIGQALASFERTLVSGNSRFDRWLYGGDKNALTADERLGFQLFMGKGHCSACHLVGSKDALFTDHKFHNTGLGWERTMFPERRFYMVQLSPGYYVQVMGKSLRSFEPPQADLGRYEVTLDPKDRWAYKTPTLRNVALTGPYMHDGSLISLDDVVEFYDKGGIDNENKSPLLVPLKLSAQEKSAVVAFLRTLTGDDVQALIADARAGERTAGKPEQLRPALPP